jgi:hypothetical protein
MSAGNAERAMTLMRTALSRIGAGDWRGAADDLVQAATLHAQVGRDYDEARCLQLAATLRRFGGDEAEADALLRQAAAREVEDLPLAVSTQAEAAEQAHAAGRMDEALAAWTTCLATAEAAGLGASGMIALLDRRSEAALALGRFDEADADLQRACFLDDAETSQRLRAQHAGRLLDLEEVHRAAAALPSTDATQDAETRAMLLTQQARLARLEGDIDAARRHAEAARVAAREALAPLPYFTASVELAEAFDAAGDRPHSYGALATTWATLGDLLGCDVARSWVEPCLLALKLRWGDDAFAAARQTYEATRRAVVEGRA